MTGVAGYNLYCGKTGTEFKLTPYETIYSADTTSYTFTDLENGFEYSFAATSFDTEGTESDFSETITYFVGDSGDLTDETQTVMFWRHPGCRLSRHCCGYIHQSEPGYKLCR